MLAKSINQLKFFYRVLQQDLSLYRKVNFTWICNRYNVCGTLSGLKLFNI